MANQLTEKEHQKLLAQLQDMETRQVFEIADEIKRAREFGDISENAEYQEAKEAQARLFYEIAQLRQKVTGVEIVKSSRSTKTVGLGSIVELKPSTGKKMTLRVTSVIESEETVVTPESPLGRALMGASVGDTVQVAARVPWKAKILAVKRG
jgi:transcription elongation factor GreA